MPEYPSGTGTVEDQPSKESWFRQWGDPMARNISTATLTPFLTEKGKAISQFRGIKLGLANAILHRLSDDWDIEEVEIYD